MDGSLYFYQSIPAAAMLILLVLNLVRKRSFFCLSTVSLLYTFAAFAGAVMMIDMPMNGYPFVNPEAMFFLTVCYSFLCLPVLYYKDGKLTDGQIMYVDERRFRFLVLLLIVLTVPAAAYFSFRSAPSFWNFLHAGVSREQFRTSVDIARTTSVAGMAMNTAVVFSHCATFAAIYGFAFRKIDWLHAVLLFIGGLSFAISTLENVARSGILEYGMLIFVLFMVFFPKMDADVRAKARRIVCVIAGLLLIPFLLLTIVRFSRGGSVDEPLGYTLFAYFSTGPYSFNADYVVRTECGLPPTKGALTCPYLPLLMDKVNGTSEYDDAMEEIDDRTQNNAPEYLAVCNGYAADFKTAVGSFLMDFSPAAVFAVMLVVCVLFVRLFKRSRNRPVDFVFASIYFFIVFMAPIGYVFVTRLRTTMLLAFILFAFLLTPKRIGE